MIHGKPTQVVACSKGAKIVRDKAGIWSHAPALRSMLASLDSCAHGCSGIPTVVLLASMAEMISLGSRLARLN